VARLDAGKVLNPEGMAGFGDRPPEVPVLLLLAAGKGTRFGSAPKCIQPVNGIPLARHSINAFQAFSRSPVICLVGYCHTEVAAALGGDSLYVRSDNPAGGTAYAAYEAFSIPQLSATNPLLIVTMGDRIVPTSIFRALHDTHRTGSREADLTFLTAIYEPPRNRGKGRVIRGAGGRVLGIVEQNDIDSISDRKVRQSLEEQTEGNCPLYVIRAATLLRHLECLSNDNAQGQFYLTDIIESIHSVGGDIRTLTTTAADPGYDLLCSDVTRPMDLALLEGILQKGDAPAPRLGTEVERASSAIGAGRPWGQVDSIALQLEELRETAARLGFQPDRPVAVGIAGGRLRIAFMHPDMGRFFGPAWQMPIGAANASGREQIVVLLQSSDDGQIHLTSTHAEFQEKVSAIPADNRCMYPDEKVADWYSYEDFGTRMAEQVLLSLGYFSEVELERRRAEGIPLPPATLWVSNSMRRPFSLVGNAITSLRTVRTGSMGARIQAVLGREHFRGLRIVSTGNIPRGGFSSSSAVTVATKNAINALFDLGIPADLLVHLSCQAEYGTGVRAGSLDQATEQKGTAGQGTLISSNPRDNYRILGTYPVPTQRFQVLFPYSVDRDREAWRWSAGVYGSDTASARLTAAEMRKMTGKSAELAALWLRLPLDRDFFKVIEDDLVCEGRLGAGNQRWVYDVLRQLPLLVSQEDLRTRLRENRSWHIDQLRECEKLDFATAAEKADAALASLLAGWRDPQLRRTLESGQTVQESGVPLRAMLAYLFGETAKNFHLIHHPDDWIEWVTRSQWGDRCFQIDSDRLPTAEVMSGEIDWEKGHAGPALMERWLERFGATPFDYNRGLDDQSLAHEHLPELPWLGGSNFFRGLALIDLAEAMVKRAFGKNAIAVRVNAAGQGDFFQVHVDNTLAAVEAVKAFIRKAFYRRFGLAPEPEFVEPHPGGGAVAVRLERFDQLPALVRSLQKRIPDSTVVGCQRFAP
jgi:GTP:adenosylcobinamide-phosphate guanylyltransferase